MITKQIDFRPLEHTNLRNFSVLLDSFFIYISKFPLIYSSLNKLSISLVFPRYFSICSLSLFNFLKIWEVNMSYFIWLHPSAFPLTSLFKVAFHYSLHTAHWINFFPKNKIKVHFYNTSWQRYIIYHVSRIPSVASND